MTTQDFINGLEDASNILASLQPTTLATQKLEWANGQTVTQHDIASSDTFNVQRAIESIGIAKRAIEAEIGKGGRDWPVEGLDIRL